MRRYQCPDCEGIFQFLHLTREEPAPLYCDLCGSYMGEEPTVELPAPALGGSALARSVEQVRVYSEERGVELKDGLRAGDIARAAAPDHAGTGANLVSNFAASVGHEYFGGGSGIPTSEVISMTKQGGERGTGAPVLRAIQTKRLERG